MKIEINEAGIRELYAGIPKKIEDVDRRFRRQYEGQPVEEARPRAKRWFGAIGVELKPGQIADQARAVSAGEPFKWVLK